MVNDKCKKPARNKPARNKPLPPLPPLDRETPEMQLLAANNQHHTRSPEDDGTNAAIAQPVAAVNSTANSRHAATAPVASAASARGPSAPPTPAASRYLTYRALYDFDGRTSGELGLQKDELVIVTQKGNEGWWLVHRSDRSASGWVPSTYLDPESDWEDIAECSHLIEARYLLDRAGTTLGEPDAHVDEASKEHTGILERLQEGYRWLREEWQDGSFCPLCNNSTTFLQKRKRTACSSNSSNNSSGSNISGEATGEKSHSTQ
ncbi:class II myosin [Taxawa tesnikishii (nom. ined.)]|nr:class II myosin [Dothideales sp. JES 119]